MRRRDHRDHRVVHLACSWFLSYPDDTVWRRTATIRAALDEAAAGRDGGPGRPADRLARFLRTREAGGQDRAQHEYIECFDLSRRSTLYLSYWSDGDTRRRGEAIGRFKQLYRDSGAVVDLRGELPDHLPILLEYAARIDPEGGTAELARHRRALDQILASLRAQDSSYAEVLGALCATLPAARAIPTLPPTMEAVGLEPFDPRSLPIVEVRR